MGSSSERGSGRDGSGRDGSGPDGGPDSAHPLTALDRRAWTLIQDLPEVLAPVRRIGPDGPTVPLFTSEAAARAHLERLPEDAPPIRILELPAGDWRRKEEWLAAAQATGTRWVEVDPPSDGSRPARTSLARAAAYVASYKRGTACL